MSEIEEMLGIEKNDGGLEKMVSKRMTELGVSEEEKEERAREAKIRDRKQRLDTGYVEEVGQTRETEMVWGTGSFRDKGGTTLWRKVEKKEPEEREEGETARKAAREERAVRERERRSSEKRAEKTRKTEKAEKVEKLGRRAQTIQKVQKEVGRGAERTTSGNARRIKEEITQKKTEKKARKVASEAEELEGMMGGAELMEFIRPEKSAKAVRPAGERKARGRKNVLYIVQDKKAAQFRYRVSNVQEATEGSERWSVEYILKSEVSRSWEALDRADLVVILRQTAKDEAILEFIAEAKRRGIKVLFDLDDLVFDFRDLPLLMRTTNSKNIAYWVGYFWGIRRIAKEVDGFLVTNEFLGRKIERSFNKPFRVIRNSLNLAQVEVSYEAIEEKERARSLEEEANEEDSEEGYDDGDFSDDFSRDEDDELNDIMDGLGEFSGAERRSGNGGSFTIGYFSGSPTHAKDFRMIEPELVRFLRDYPDARLRIVGYMELSAEMRRLKERGRVEILRLVDYLKLQKLMGEVDVNVAPLVLNDFTNCKSELKFFEAGAVKTVTIASPSFTFSSAIRDGENGFLAKPGEWYGKLQFLYGNPDKSLKMAERARRDALKNYFGEKFLREVEEAYEFFGE